MLCTDLIQDSGTLSVYDLDYLNLFWDAEPCGNQKMTSQSLHNCGTTTFLQTLIKFSSQSYSGTCWQPSPGTKSVQTHPSVRESENLDALVLRFLKLMSFPPCVTLTCFLRVFLENLTNLSFQEVLRMVFNAWLELSIIEKTSSLSQLCQHFSLIEKCNFLFFGPWNKKSFVRFSMLACFSWLLPFPNHSNKPYRVSRLKFLKIMEEAMLSNKKSNLYMSLRTRIF